MLEQHGLFRADTLFPNVEQGQDVAILSSDGDDLSLVLGISLFHNCMEILGWNILGLDDHLAQQKG